MQEIADRAGINKALLHYYFRSKDKLYKEVFFQIVNEFFGTLADSIPQQSGIQEFLRTFIQQYLDQLVKNPALVKFMVWEVGDTETEVGEQLKQILIQKGLEEFPVLTRIRVAMEQGEIRQVDPIHFTFSLIGMCLYPFFARPIIEKVFSGVQVLDPEFVEQRKREIFRLVWEGIRK